MNANAIVRVCWLCVLLAGASISAQQIQTLDLREEGYAASKPMSNVLQRHASSQILSISNNGDVAVGFVTKDKSGLATREPPPLSFHIVSFTKVGQFLFQSTIPTSSWYENSLFYGQDRRLLVHAGPKLLLFSETMQRLVDKDLLTTQDSMLLNWRIYPLRNRTAFLLYTYRRLDTSIELIRWDNLQTIKRCRFDPSDRVLDVSDDMALLFHSTNPKDPLRRVAEATDICGHSRFVYSWRGDTVNAVLIRGGLLLAGGGSSITFVMDGHVQWTDSFDKKTDLVNQSVKSSADGRFAVIAVSHFGGGSRFRDLPRKLAGIKVLMYDVTTGKKLIEIPIAGTQFVDFDFALSPAGDVLAVTCEGILQLITLTESRANRSAGPRVGFIPADL